MNLVSAPRPGPISITQSSGVSFACDTIHAARLRSCKKFWPSVFTGETRMSRSVESISDNFIGLAASGPRCRRKSCPCSQKSVNKTLRGADFIHKLLARRQPPFFLRRRLELLRGPKFGARATFSAGKIGPPGIFERKAFEKVNDGCPPDRVG